MNKRFFLFHGLFLTLVLSACGGGESGSQDLPDNNGNPTANISPTSDAGSDQSVPVLATVTLDGSGSSDSDGSISSYLWEQISGSPVVSINNSTSVTASFNAPNLVSSATLVFQLTVTDDDGDSESSTTQVTINPANVSPSAEAGNEQTVNVGDSVSLNAAGSSDSDGNIVSYQWSQTAGTSATLANTDSVSASFNAPAIAEVSETLSFEVLITDDDGATATDSVDIHVYSADISSVTPANNADDAEPDTLVTATFVKNLLNTSIDDQSFYVKNSDDVSLSGTLNFDAVNKVISFTPDSELDLLGQYHASATTAITDLSGNPLSMDNNWSFSVRDGIWRDQAEYVESADIDAYSPQVVMDKDGNVVAVWLQAAIAGQNLRVWSNRIDADSGNWGTPEMIDDSSSGTNNLQLVVDAGGNAIAVWGQGGDVYFNRFDAVGKTWASAQAIESQAESAYFSAQFNTLDIDGANNIYAIWNESQGNKVWINKYSSNAWGTPVQVNSGTKTVAAPQLAINPDGDILVIWQQYDDSDEWEIWGRYYDAQSDSWSVDQAVENDTGYSTKAQVSIDAQGNGMASWILDNNGDTSIRSSRFIAATNSWETGKTVASGDNLSMKMTMYESSALLLWTERDPSTFEYNLYSSQFDTVNDAWTSAETVITSSPSFEITIEDLAFDGNNNFMAVYTAGASSIRYSRYQPSSNSWGTSGHIRHSFSGNTFIGSVYTPKVAFADNGKGIAVWLQSVSFNYNIVGNHFE